eukprot:4495982-Prymnesium_polylepis.1
MANRTRPDVTVTLAQPDAMTPEPSLVLPTRDRSASHSAEERIGGLLWNLPLALDLFEAMDHDRTGRLTLD